MPDLRIVLGHAGFPRRRDDTYRAVWRRELRALARAPNVAVKVSGLPMADHGWTVESLRPWVLETIEAFGPDRVMFGTNWPVDSLFSTYDDLVDADRQILGAAGFSLDDRHTMLHGTAERIYGIETRPGGPIGGAVAVVADA
jgi:predicted TIM-barrel fold metal-dependent hydrolase